MKKFKALSILFISFLIIIPVSAQIITIGSPDCVSSSGNAIIDILVPTANIDLIACAQSGFQKWTTVSANPSLYRRSGQFRIVSIEQGTVSPWDDGDWRIWTAPLGTATSLLNNAQGYGNWNGRIELELLNRFPLNHFFHVNDIITAYGWHVEDWGHGVGGNTPAGSNGGKTELHPFVYLQKGELSDTHFWLFAGQDASDRFPLAQTRLESWFPDGWTIPMTRNMHNIDLAPLLFSTKNENWSMNVLRERGHHSNIGGLSAPLDQQLFNNVIIKPRLPGQKPNVKWSDNPTLWYFGDFTRYEKEALHHRISVNLDGTAPNQAIIADVTVSVSPLLPVDGRHYNTEWTYWDAEFGQAISALPGPLYRALKPSTQIALMQKALTQQGRMIPVEVRNPDANTVTFKLIYSPARGFNETSWPLEVFVDDWGRGNYESPDAQVGMGKAWERALSQESIQYSIKPSSLDVTVAAREGQVEIPGGPFDQRIRTMECTKYYTLTADKYVALPEIESSELVWGLHTIGQAQDVIHIMDADDQWYDLGTVQAKLRPDRLQLEVEFDLSVTPDDPTGLPMRNYTKLIVKTSFTTSLGEEPNHTEELGLSGCTRDYPSFADAWRDFEKMILAVIKLEELGLASPSLDKNLSRLQTLWPSVKNPLGAHWYEWYPSLPPKAKELADTYKLVMEGKPVSADRMNQLLVNLKAASQLPEIPGTGLDLDEQMQWKNRIIR